MKCAAGALALALLAATPARADEPISPYDAPAAATKDVATTLAAANKAAVAGDWAAVDRDVAPLLAAGIANLADRAEAHRLLGLAAYYLKRAAAAEKHFLAYLSIEPDARLDPTVVPPEAIAFFEEVRERHAVEVKPPRTTRSRIFVLNFIPAAGQFQNGHRVKGFLVGGGIVVLAATSVTTYLVLDSWCGDDHLCESSSGRDRAGSARTLQGVNIAAGIGAIALYAYGVVDGIIYYRRKGAALRLEPTQGGGAVVLSGRF